MTTGSTWLGQLGVGMAALAVDLLAWNGVLQFRWPGVQLGVLIPVGLVLGSPPGYRA